MVTEFCNKMNKLMCVMDCSNADYFLSWLIQWDENLEYSMYKAEDVELLTKEDMLFLIPRTDRKPTKVIIA